MATIVQQTEEVVVLKKTSEYDVVRTVHNGGDERCLCGASIENGQPIVKVVSHDASCAELLFCTKGCLKAVERKAKDLHRQSTKRAKKSTLLFILEARLR